MRLLIRLEIQPPPQFRQPLRRVNLIMLALIPELAAVRRRPQPQHHLQRLPPPVAHLVHTVILDAVKLQIRRQRAQPNAPIKPPAGHVIQHRDAMRRVDRMMQRQHRHPGSQNDLFRKRQSLRDNQLRHRRIFPSFGDMLPHPSLMHPQLIRLHNQLHIPRIRLRRRPPRRMQRHHKQSKLHYPITSCLISLSFRCIQTAKYIDQFQNSQS